MFLCAPGVAATKRFAWLADLARSGRYGAATLVVAHHADPGPAAWREYTGDPRPFYRPGVGPVIDHGVYRLHGMTMLLGPVTRVQAMGTIGVPTRVVRGGPLTGERIEVTTPDHVLINLEFASGALGQLLASFGTAATRAPWLELHLERATVSFGGQSHDPGAPVSIYIDDDSPAAREDWHDDIEVPVDERGVVETGVRHFIDCLRGEATPVLTAEHARHVLDIIERAYASIDDGASHATVDDLLARYRASPTRKKVSIGPLPLTSISPREVRTNRSRSRRSTAPVTWIRPGTPVDSMRDATLTVSPHRS